MGTPQVTLNVPLLQPLPCWPTSLTPRPLSWGKWAHTLWSALWAKEPWTWHGRVASLYYQAGSTRDAGFESFRVEPRGKQRAGQTVPGRDTSSGGQQEGSEHSPAGGCGEVVT